MKNKPHGGKRQGSGAKPKYNEPTKTIAFRIPISKEAEARQMIKDFQKKCNPTY